MTGSYAGIVVYMTSSLGLGGLCQHNFGNNRHEKALSIIGLYSGIIRCVHDVVTYSMYTMMQVAESIT